MLKFGSTEASAQGRDVRSLITSTGAASARVLETAVDHLPLTVFRRSALVSGLLTVEHILEAEKALRAASGPVGTWTEIGDETLAAKLVELGRLNRWQAEQLKVGRTKF